MNTNLSCNSWKFLRFCVAVHRGGWYVANFCCLTRCRAWNNVDRSPIWASCWSSIDVWNTHKGTTCEFLGSGLRFSVNKQHLSFSLIASRLIRSWRCQKLNLATLLIFHQCSCYSKEFSTVAFEVVWGSWRNSNILQPLLIIRNLKLLNVVGLLSMFEMEWENLAR